MKVLGDWNWYLPKWLEWLPHVGTEGDIAPPSETPDAEHREPRQPAGAQA
jgi:RND superfamily putative drug exporter